MVVLTAYHGRAVGLRASRAPSALLPLAVGPTRPRDVRAQFKITVKVK